jgi:secondary thiamine-phosphate synthase enzyme
MLKEFTVQTNQNREFVDITERVQTQIQASKVSDGMCLVYSPHTTAAVTINENADPDVVSDLLRAYADVIGDERRFRHAEGNSGAHALTSLVGPSVTVPIHNGQVHLGRWQAIYLCEFDGPRERTVQVHVLGDRGASS